jgi:hypothetical protein
VLSEPKYSARSEEEISCALLAGVGQFQCRSFNRKTAKRGEEYSHTLWVMSTDIGYRPAFLDGGRLNSGMNFKFTVGWRVELRIMNL